MNKRKIAIAVPDVTFTGGAEKVAINLAKALSDNYDVTIISLFEWQNREQIFLKNVAIKNVTLGLQKRSNLLARFWLNVKLSKKLKNLFKDFDYVIGNNFFRYYVYPFKTNAKLCEIQHLRFEEESGKDSLLRCFMYRKLHRVIVLTSRDAKKFSDAGYENVEVIPNFINHYIDHVEYNCNSKKIVAIGRLTYQKNHDDMLKIMSLFLNDNKDYTLHILGDGSEREHIENKIIELGLVENVILHGAVDNVDEHLAEACVLISTSRYEGFPLSFLEALNHELPIVTYDFNSGARDLVHDGVNGRLIEMGDETDFAYKLTELLNNNDIKIKFSHGAKSIKAQYKEQEITNQWRLRVFTDD